MKIARLSIITLALMILLAGTAQAGVTRIQVRPFVGLFGGGNALDGISGYTISPDDYAIGHDGTGTTFYAMMPVDSGSTTESTSPPYVVCPDTLQAVGGDPVGGTTTWQQAALSGNTIWGKVFVVDNRPLTGAMVDLWNAIMSGATTYYWNGVTQPVQAVLNQVAVLLGTSPYYFRTDTQTLNDIPESGTSKTVSATQKTNWDTAYGWGDHSAQNYFDIDTDTLDNVPDGTTYKLIPAITKTELDSLLSGNSKYYTDLTSDGQTQIDSKASNTKVDAAGAPGATSATSMYAVPELKSDATAKTEAAAFENSTGGATKFAKADLSNLSGQTAFAGTSAFFVSFTVANPDCWVNGVPGGNTPFPIFNVDPGQYPSGVTIIYCNGQVASGATAYLFVFEEWNSGASVAQISRFTTPTSGASAYQSGATVVKAGSDVYLNPPSTGAYTIRGALRFFRR